LLAPGDFGALISATNSIYLDWITGAT